MKKTFTYALCWLLILAAIFFLTYHFTNMISASKQTVTSFYFSWEKSIPLLPWTIIPYWFLDLFYGLAFFLCRSRREIKRLALRLLTVQLISTFCFLLFPLKFAFNRPNIEGFFGELFSMLMTFDLPFNQAPSLHISISAVLFSFYYSRVSTRWAKFFVIICFALICCSVLTTWQHHFIDMPTGLLVGLLSIWLFPKTGKMKLNLRLFENNWKIASAYFILAIVSFICSLKIGGWGLWLSWFSVSMLLVSINYGLIGENGFQKQKKGHFLLSNLLLYAPYICMMFVNSRLWTIKTNAIDHVIENVYLGRLPTRQVLKQNNFKSVIDMTAEFPVLFGFLPSQYRSIPLLDLSKIDVQSMVKAAELIDKMNKKGRVLVYCGLGFSRSATVVLAWLILTSRVDNIEDGIKLIKQRRPNIHINNQDSLRTLMYR